GLKEPIFFNDFIVEQWTLENFERNALKEEHANAPTSSTSGIEAVGAQTEILDESEEDEDLDEEVSALENEIELMEAEN
ncbi:hypothetical protein HK098_000279, partial [Nowakowskiella sp. JEL0407]